MIPMERGQELHGRSCSNENLTTEERGELLAWYAEMDAQESAALNVDLPESSANDEVRARIRHLLGELHETLQAIRKIDESNESLRRQNEELKTLLVAKGILAA